MPAVPQHLSVAADAVHGGEGSGRRLSLTHSTIDPMTSSTTGSGRDGSVISHRTFRFWHHARRTLGISLLLVTVFLWTASNFLASYIFSDHTYDKPFFVVYVNSFVFALQMIPISIKYVMQHGGLAAVRDQVLDTWKKGRRGGFRRPRSSAESETAMVEERLIDAADDAADEEESLATLDVSRQSDDKKLPFLETAKLSLEFAMIWFVGNYFSSACLEYTSVASVTILTSTSSVWTLMFCAILRIEPFSVPKLVGVLASLSGVILISLVDLSGNGNDEDRGSFPHKTQAQIAIGDAMALFSAVVYGLYVVTMKVRVGNEDRVNMSLFFGLVGTFSCLLLWPLFFILHFTGIEPFELPPNGKVWAIILMNSLSSFISDISWAYAMLLTTPLVVTVGLSLTIPLSLIGEMIQYAQHASFAYWVGAVIVVLSFVFINHESKEEEEEEERCKPLDSESAL
ncbi:hypothetical protein F5Y17DRAFT_411959 [Xylariaceae sp. FL0594]|nr:hypothetical protein F5Y17DRAFT_411959 [Xylariaceae sp. FL0594]